MKTGKQGLAPLLVLPVIWGSYYIASQQLVGYTSVFASGVGIRFLTMLFLTVIMWRREELPRLLQVHGIWPRLLLIGTFGFLLDLTAFIGLSMSSAAGGTALLKCDVLMVNILSMIIYKQRFTWKAWGCTFVMLFGVFLVMGVNITTLQIGDPGNIFFLLSALFVSLNAFVIKSVQLDKKNPACDDVVAYYNNFVTLVYFTGTALFMGSIGQLGLAFSKKEVGLALFLSSLAQTMIYVVYYHNLRNYAVWVVKVFLLFMPVVSAILAFALFQERIAAKQYLGMAVVIIGALGILLDQKHT